MALLLGYGHAGFGSDSSVVEGGQTKNDLGQITASVWEIGVDEGESGLVRRGVEMLERLEGWRLTLVGLTLTGLGAAWFWDLRWLLFLSLAIGFVEIQEASMVIRAWRAGERNAATRPRSTPVRRY